MPWKSMAAAHRELEKELHPFSHLPLTLKGKSVVLITLKGHNGLVGYEGEDSI